MDKTVFLYQWFSFDVQYYFILNNTNNVLHSSVIVKITARKLAFCKSTSHIPANIPHPTSQTRHIPNISYPQHLTPPTLHIFNIPHPKHPTSQTFHILNIPHPISQTPHISNIPHPQHPTSRTISKYVLRLSIHVFLAP